VGDFDVDINAELTHNVTQQPHPTTTTSTTTSTTTTSTTSTLPNITPQEQQVVLCDLAPPGLEQPGTLTDLLITFLADRRQKYPLEHARGYTIKALATSIRAESPSVGAALRASPHIFKKVDRGIYKLRDDFF